jgi:hypothetical protein
MPKAVCGAVCIGSVAGDLNLKLKVFDFVEVGFAAFEDANKKLQANC